MSQIVRAVTAVDTGQRKVIDNKMFSPLFQDVFQMQERIEDVHSADYITAKLYRIGITLGHQAMVTDNNLKDGPDELEYAIERAKKSIVEAIFGEFREDFMRLSNALYDRDYQKAQALLVQFERKMFEV